MALVEGGRGEVGDATAASEGLGVRRAQGAVDGGGEVVVVQAQCYAQVGLESACGEGGLQVRGVRAGECEQGVCAVDLGCFQDAFFSDVAKDDRHTDAAGERDAAGVRVLLDAHDGDLELAQSSEDAGADLSETEQHDMPGQTARGSTQSVGGAEGAQGFEGAYDEEGEQGEADKAGEELQDLTAGRLADGGVVDREEVEQGQIGGVHGVGVGEQDGGHGQGKHRGGDAA